MTTHTVNEERGEVAITLDGGVYPLRPSWEAIQAIESEIGSISGARARLHILVSGLTLREMAVIATEGMRAAGVDRDDPLLRKTSVDRVSKLIAEAGISSCHPAIGQFLFNAMNGGTKSRPKKSDDVETTSASTIAG